MTTEASRLFRIRHPERNHELQMKWRNENKEKRRAHRMVEHRLKMGTMIKLPCEVCQNINSHGHHEDYSKPLEVNWLCSRHHHDKHMEKRK